MYYPLVFLVHRILALEKGSCFSTPLARARKVRTRGEVVRTCVQNMLKSKISLWVDGSGICSSMEPLVLWLLWKQDLKVVPVVSVIGTITVAWVGRYLCWKRYDKIVGCGAGQW